MDRILFILRDAVDFYHLSRLSPNTYKITENVLYYCQFASPELTKDILEKKIPASTDPRWMEFGFDRPEDYEFWSWRACAIICLKMVIETLFKTNVGVRGLIDSGLEVGGYIPFDKDGKLIDKGWYYNPLITLSEQHGLNGKLLPYLSNRGICREILKKHFVIASVNPEVIRYDTIEARNGKGGHLVLVHGFQWEQGKCKGFIIHNPSGKQDETRANAFIPIEVFEKAFAMRGFSIWKD